jgi:hypothetical protein
MELVTGIEPVTSSLPRTCSACRTILARAGENSRIQPAVQNLVAEVGLEPTACGVKVRRAASCATQHNESCSGVRLPAELRSCCKPSACIPTFLGALDRSCTCFCGFAVRRLATLAPSALEPLSAPAQHNKAALPIEPLGLLVQPARIELAFPRRKPGVLPLNDGCEIWRRVEELNPWPCRGATTVFKTAYAPLRGTLLGTGSRTRTLMEWFWKPPLCPLSYPRANTWWLRMGSNHRRARFHSTALPLSYSATDEVGEPGWIRTTGPRRDGGYNPARLATLPPAHVQNSSIVKHQGLSGSPHLSSNLLRPIRSCQTHSDGFSSVTRQRRILAESWLLRWDSNPRCTGYGPGLAPLQSTQH